MAEDVEDQSLAKFIAFSEAGDLSEVVSCFYSLCKAVQLDPTSEQHSPRDFYSLLKQRLQQWRCKALWSLLDARCELPEYGGSSGSCQGKRVLVIGAGPVGLRSAIEAALLGASVDLVEKRTSFSRNNVLHLWPYLIDDLKALGAKKFYGKFCAGAIDHISIKMLQSVLLKVCLLLGVRVHYPVTFQDLIEPRSQSDSWRVSVTPSSSQVSAHFYDAIISADGKQYCLPGFRSKEFRAKLAIAITVNFVNRGTQQEAAVEEISGVAFIYNQAFFANLAKAHGIELENIVYYKDDTHYFVMTAKKSSLLAKGVIKQDCNNAEMLLSSANISRTALETYAKEAATFSTKGGLGKLEFAPNHRGENDVAIFDFTSLFASENASRIVERKGKKLLMCVAGDSLLEPFWPTGSGLARGFLGAFDAAWMFKRYCEGVAAPLELIEEREALFRLLPSTTPERLQKKTSSYTINPHSRYPNLNLVAVSDVSHLYDSDTIPKPETKEQVLEFTAPKVKRYNSMGTRSPRRTVQPVPPTLEAIRASQSPGPPIEFEKPVTLDEPLAAPPPPTKKSSSDFSLLKFARLLFGGKKSRTPQAEEEKPVKAKTPEPKRTPERKRSHGSKPKNKERKKSKSKSPERRKETRMESKKKTEKEQTPPSVSNTATTSGEKQPLSDHKNASSTVQHLTQLYESNSTHSSSTVEVQTTPSNMSLRPVTRGTVASAIERLEQRKKGGTEMTDSGVMEQLENEEREQTDDSYFAVEEAMTTAIEGEEQSIIKVTTGENATSVEVDETEKELVMAEKEDIKGELNEKGDLLTENQQVIEESHGPRGNLEMEVEADEKIYAPNESQETSVETSDLSKERSHTISITTTSRYNNEEDATPTSTRPLMSPERHYLSKDDSAVRLTSKTNETLYLATPKWLQKFTASLTKCFELLREENSNIYSIKTTLEVLNFIFNNIIADPEEDTYRRVRVTSEHFINHVYQYSGAQHFLWMSGWMEVDEYLVLPLNQSLDVPKRVLDRQMETVELMCQSAHLNSRLLGKTFPKQSSFTSQQQQCYTDSIVLQALNKSQRDQSVMMAAALKDKVSRRNTGSERQETTEETDGPSGGSGGHITRQEEVIMMSSASHARAWWEKKLQRHPSTYSLYFQHDELEELHSFAQEEKENEEEEEDSRRGVVAERVKTFEQTSDTKIRRRRSYSYSSSEDEMSYQSTADYSCSDDEEDTHSLSATVDQLLQEEDQSPSLEQQSIEAPLVISKRNIHQLQWEEEHSQDISAVTSSSANEVAAATDQSVALSSSSLNDESVAKDPVHLKWLQATRVSEQICLKRQQASKQEKTNL